MKNFNLYIGITKILPELPTNEEHEIIYCLEDGELSKSDKLDYVLMVLCNSNSETLVTEIKENWKELTGDEIHISLLTDKVENTRKRIRKLYKETNDGDIYFKSPFVAFFSDSEKGKNEALRLMRSSAIKN